MKKFLIVLINIFFIVVAFFVIDCCALMFLFKDRTLGENWFAMHLAQVSRSKIAKFYLHTIMLRNVENADSKKKPIVVFGCSFAWGHDLKDDETFSYRLAQLTGRPVYNRALPGMSTQHMLYQLQNEEFYEIVPKPEYVIYVYIQTHVPRIYIGSTPVSSRYVFYKEKKSKSGERYLVRNYLKEIIHRSYFVYLIENKLLYNQMKSKPTKQNIEFLKLHIAEARKEVDEYWGKDVKFVVLLYEKEKFIENLKPMITDLEKDGIQFIDINDLSDKNFLSEEYQLSKQDKHPNAKAWEVLTPLLVKKLGL